MRVRWTPEAAADLSHISEYIGERQPAATLNVGRTIYGGIAELSKHPRRGRPSRMPNTRELVFPGLPYLAIYEIKHETVEILRILYGSQRWP